MSLILPVVCSAQEPIKWGADDEGGAPYIFSPEDDPNKIIGFEVDLVAALEKELQRPMRHVRCKWENILQQLERRDFDLAINGYEYTPERASQYLASIPYYKFEVGLCVRKDRPPLTTWEELGRLGPGRRKWRVGVLGASSIDKYVTETYEATCDIQRYEGLTEVFKLVENEQLDATIQDWPPLQWYIKLRPRFPDLQIVDAPIPLGHYVIYARSDDGGALVEDVNAALRMLHQSGELRRIYDNYGLWSDVQARLPEEWKAWPPKQQADPNRKGRVLWLQWPLLFKAAGYTVLLSVLSMPLAVLAGLILALVRAWHLPGMGGSGEIGSGLLRVLNVLATLYIEIVRGTPLAFQLFVVYFVLPSVLPRGMSIDAFWSGVVALAINYSAYEAEIMRLGLQAIPRGQMEAALALGMPRPLAVRRIVLPQALRIVIPATANDFIALFKDTAVCSVIAVQELSRQYQLGANNTGYVLEMAAMASILYLSMSYPLSLAASGLERRLKRS